jgi:membrane-associated protease RseP (regulator of RpoE activity)
MKRLLLILSACGLLTAARAAEPEKGAYLGVLFGPVAEALYEQLPQLPHDRGVLVTQVLADSPAEKAGLRRHDILLKYDGKKIGNCEDLVRLLQGDKPDHSVKLTLLRGGKETTAEAALTLGPAIKTAEEVAPGVAKPGKPSTVSVAAAPLERGRMRVTIEFFAEEEGRLNSVVCEGAPDEIDSQIEKQVPARERGMVQVALKRIRTLNAAKASDKATGAP